MLFNFLNNKKIFLVFLFLIFFTTGCGEPNKDIYQDSWKDDVLVAQDCGLSGLTCCFDKEKKCETGLECCPDPSDESKGYCGETCDAGKLDKYCRKDEPRCDGTAVCVDNYCTACGVTGNPCCADHKCFDQDKKDVLHAECINKVCELCGQGGEQSCLGEFKCADGTLNNGGFCLKCGGPNQPCCAGEKACNQDMTCQLGFCS